MERDISRKSIAVCGSEMRFRFIEDRRADYPVTIMAFNMPRRSSAKRCSPQAFQASMSRRAHRKITLRWRPSPTPSKPGLSITSIMRHARKPDLISLLRAGLKKKLSDFSQL